MIRVPRKRVAGTAAAVLVAGALVGATSTPTMAMGEESTYVVLAPQGQSTAKAADRVAAAGGTVVASYDKIGVLVARSSNTAFAGAVAGAGVESVASTDGLGTAIDEGATTSWTPRPRRATPRRSRCGDSSGTWPRSTSPRPTRSRPVTRRSSSACWTAASTPRTPTSRPRSRRTRAPRASAASSTRTEAAWNPTTSDHGTHVAGTIAAAINGVGIAGVAPGVKVASVKVVNDDGFIYPEAAVCGFMWAAEHGMQVTNNSYFIDPWEFNCRNDARQRPVWQAVQRAIRYS